MMDFWRMFPGHNISGVVRKAKEATQVVPPPVCPWRGTPPGPTDVDRGGFVLTYSFQPGSAEKVVPVCRPLSRYNATCPCAITTN